MTRRKRTGQTPTASPDPCLEDVSRACAVDYHPALRLRFGPTHGRGRALERGSERECWGVSFTQPIEDTCHSLPETGPWILLSYSSANCPLVQRGATLASSDVC